MKQGSPIDMIRQRLASGEPTPDDWTWAAARRQVLADWPGELSPEQKREFDHLGEVIDAAQS